MTRRPGWKPPSSEPPISFEEEYRRLFEESRDAIYIGTADGRLLDVNPAYVELFGYGSKEEMLRLDIGRDLYWNPEDRKRAWAELEARGYLEDLELELKTRGGRRIRARESASAIHDPEGRIWGFRGILRDVTEQRKLEEQLRQSQKMEAVGRLAGGVAHDFSNLLTAINGYSQLLMAKMADDDPQRGAVAEILAAGRRAADLTRRLLLLSRQQVAAPRRLDLNRVVADVELLLRRVLGEDVALVTRLGPGLGAIHADSGQIEQLLLNLAVNARDAMPEGGRLVIETRDVELESRPGREGSPAPGGYVRLTVRDTGEGMDEEVRQRVFEPFYTTKSKGEGSGLGLSIVYGIVHGAGGHIELESSEGAGSTFHLYFPHAEKAAPPPAPTPEEPSADPMPRGDEAILLVEDEPGARTAVAQILEHLGYRVLTAGDAAEAIEIFEGRDRPPDLLLTDVVMPGRSGVELAEELHRRAPELPILFMSGYTDRHSGVRLVSERRAAFLAKPFPNQLLARKVRETLDR
jgi:PAS domain S-box-containing protein